jgi:hypothetical protein
MHNKKLLTLALLCLILVAVAMFVGGGLPWDRIPR